MQDLPEDFDFSFKDIFSPFTTRKAIIWIVVVGLVVYFNMLYNGFVWDDNPQIVNNPLVHSLGNFTLIFLNHSDTYYRPFSDLIYTILFTLFGTGAFWYHLSQLLLHIANSILVFLLFKRFFKVTLSFFLSLIFLVHPMQVETVSYISSLQTVAALFFSLLTIVVIERRKLLTTYSYILLFFLLLIAALTKEIALIFIPILLMFMRINQHYIYSKKQYISVGIVSVSVIICYSILRFFVGGTTPLMFTNSFVPIMAASTGIKLITLPKILFYYLFTFIFPLNLAISQQWLVTSPDFQNFFFPLFVDVLFFVLVIVFGVYLTRKKSKDFKFFIFFFTWFVLSWIAAWQLVPLDMTVADRWFYFPMIGLLGMVGVEINNLKIVGSTRKFVFGIVVIGLILLSIRTMVRNEDWNNNISLFTHDETLSQSYDVENLLGVEYYQAFEYPQAKLHIERSIELAPNAYENWDNLGVYYLHFRQYNKAIAAFSQAVKNNPNFSQGYLNIASAYYDISPKKQTMYLSGLVAKYPNVPTFLYWEALSDYKMGNRQKALSEIQKAYSMSNNSTYLSVYNQMKINSQNLN